MTNFILTPRLVLIPLLTVLASCTVHPSGEKEERDVALQAGKPFDKPIETRQLPPLPENPSPAQLVEYAQLSNADLERTYWEWRSAIEQIPQDATQTASFNLSAGTAITNGHANWGSSTLALSNDPMTDIKWPGKLNIAAKQTLENAKAAGHRFIKAKYELRSKVLIAYFDYALNAELIRLEQSNQQLLKTSVMVTESQNRAGSSSQQNVLKASNELDISRNDIANMESQLPSQRAAINALLSRQADAPLPVPAKLPPARSLVYEDEELIDLTANQNPELIALADEIRGRQDGIQLAKLQYVPDFNLSAGTDVMGITQSLLGQVTIPLFRYEALNAAIAQAEANLRASQAMRRQTSNDLAAQVITNLTIIRDTNRQLALYAHTILPRARRSVAITRSAYETGRASLLDLLDNQRSMISIERLAATLEITQQQRLVELETVASTDLTHHPDSNENIHKEPDTK